MPPRPKEPFETYVKEQADGCHIWTGTVNNSGYGWYRRKGAHVYIYIRKHGPVPEGLEIGHLCGVKLCVNPAHLEAMTHEKNNQQMKSGVKLTEKKVQEIREKSARGVSARSLASKFGVNRNAIYSIRRGEKWKEKSKHAQR